MKELSRKQKKRVLDITLDDLAQANSYFTSKIEPLLRDRLSAYRAEKSLYERKFERLSARSDMRVFDFWATVESLIPPLMQSFFGADQIVSVVGREPEDAHKGELFKKLLDWQILEQNHGFLVFNDWFVDALRFELGVLKAHWIRDTQHEEVEETLDAEKIAVIAATPGVTVLSCSETPDEYGLFDIRYQTSRMVENRPVIEVVHPFHLRWTPTAVSVETAPFVAQKKYVTGDELRRKAKRGIYDAKAVEAAIESAGSPDYSQIEQDLNDELGTSQNTADDSSRTVVELYECCVTMDADGDGLSENLLVTVANDQLLRVSENSYGRAPFFVISASRDPFKVCPDFGFAEVVSEIQHLKTAMVRLLVLNMSLNNTPRSFIDDTRVNHEDLLADKQYIRVNGQPGMAIYSQPIQPVAAWTMPFLEYTETLLEQWTGRTRYNQGLDANSLNKMLALDTPIPLIDGSYKRNADIVDGDIVVASDGKGTKVLKAHPVQIPDRAFELTFKSGDVIRAGGEHRWSVKVCDKRYKNFSPEWEKLPTERIFDLMQSGHKVFIPRVAPVDFTEKKLPIPPYLLGAWLGDGNAHTNRFTTMDTEIVKAFTEWAEQFYGGGVEECRQQHSGKAKTYQLVHTPFRRMLKDLGVLKDSRYDETRNNVKRIPEIYLRGSFEQRLALIRGLMDTDGCIDKQGNAIFCNSEPMLVETFALLVESLGGKPNVNWTQPDVSKFKHARPHAHVTFALPYCPVSLSSKASRWKLSPSYWEKQAIVAIREIPVEPMRCLTVAADDELYCCGRRFTLTSNTATGATLIMNASTQRLGHLIRTFAETGVGQLYKFLVRMNQLYISNAQVFRLTNETLNISPDDMAGTYDIAIASDIGIGSRQSTIQNLQLFLGMLFPQGAQLGCCGPQEWANAARKLLRIIGIREVDALIREPQMQQPGFPPGMPQGMPGVDTGIPTEAMIAQAMSHRDPNMTGGERRVDGRAETPTFGKTFGTGNGKQDLAGLPPSLAGIASRDFVAQGG